MVSLLLFIACITLPLRLSDAFTLYCSADGNDAHDGLSEQQAFRTVQHAVDVLKSGGGATSLLLRRGGVFSLDADGISLGGLQGADGAPIIFGAYPENEDAHADDRPILMGDAAGGGILLKIYGDSNYIEVRDVIFDTLAPHTIGPVGIRICCGDEPRPHHITLRRINVQNTANGIINYAHDFLMDSCVIRNNHNLNMEGGGHAQGIYTTGDNTIIRRCEFENSGKPNSWFDHLVYLSHSHNVLVEHCYLHNALDGIKTRAGSDVTLRNNFFEGIAMSMCSMGGDSGSRFDRGRVYNNVGLNCRSGPSVAQQSGGGHGAHDVSIFNNVFLHSMRGSITGDRGEFITVDNDGNTGIHIMNNLFIDIHKRHVRVELDNLVDFVLANNVHVTEPGASSRGALIAFRRAVDFSDAIIDNNVYDIDVTVDNFYDIRGSVHETFGDVQSDSAAHVEANSQVGTGIVQFNDDRHVAYRPHTSSAAYGTARDVTQWRAGDFFGVLSNDAGPFHRADGTSGDNCLQRGGFECGHAWNVICVSNVTIAAPTTLVGDTCCTVPCGVYRATPNRDKGHQDTLTDDPFWSGPASPGVWSPVRLSPLTAPDSTTAPLLTTTTGATVAATTTAAVAQSSSSSSGTNAASTGTQKVTDSVTSTQSATSTASPALTSTQGDTFGGSTEPSADEDENDVGDPYLLMVIGAVLAVLALIILCIAVVILVRARRTQRLLMTSTRTTELHRRRTNSSARTSRSSRRAQGLGMTLSGTHSARTSRYNAGPPPPPLTGSYQALPHQAVSY